jgi:hypothetical protein
MKNSALFLRATAVCAGTKWHAELLDFAGPKPYDSDVRVCGENSTGAVDFGKSAVWRRHPARPREQ